MPALAVAAALTPREIAAELAACEVALPAPALEQLSAYLELLLRWNRRINLTGLQDPRLIVRRLFGESLYLAKLTELQGWLVDVGSGAGFPGLALKLAAPDLQVTLVEPRRRKAAFLKEAIRQCRFTATVVVVNRFEPWAERQKGEGSDFITTRAVELSPNLLQSLAQFLAPAGTAVLFTTVKLAQDVKSRKTHLSWADPVRIPGTEQSAILLGRKVVQSNM